MNFLTPSHQLEQLKLQQHYSSLLGQNLSGLQSANFIRSPQPLRPTEEDRDNELLLTIEE